MLTVFLPVATAGDDVDPIVYVLQVGSAEEEGDITNPGETHYLVNAHSPYGDLLINMYLINLLNHERTNLFDNYKVRPGNPVSGSYNAVLGEYQLVLEVIDQKGNTIVDGFYFIVSEEEKPVIEGPILSILDYTSPILVSESDVSGILDIKVSNSSENPAGNIKIGWRYSDDPSGYYRETASIDFGSKYQISGVQDFSFSIPVNQALSDGLQERDIVLVVDIDGEEPIIRGLSISYDYPTVKIENKTVLDRDNNTAYIAIDVEFTEDTALDGSKTRVEVVTEKENQVIDRFYVELEKGQMKTIVRPIVLSSKVHEIDVYIIPDKQIYHRRNTGMIVDMTKEKFTNLLALYVDSGAYRQGETIELEAIFSMAAKSEPINDNIRVVLDIGDERLEKTIRISPGEIKYTTFEYTVPVSEEKTVRTEEVRAGINPGELYNEITYSDNWAIGHLVILPNINTNQTCDTYPRNTRGISAEVYTSAFKPAVWDSECDSWVNEDGETEWDCWDYLVEPAECLPPSQAIYYEEINISDWTTSRTTVKAGMGFGVEGLETHYFNSFDQVASYYGITVNIDEDFSELGFDGMEQKLDMVNLEPIYNSWNRWILPRAKIIRGQGDMEMVSYFNQDGPFYNLDTNTYVDGDNNFYTSFYLKDGPLDYVIHGQYAGSGQKYIIYDTRACPGGGLSISTVKMPYLSDCKEGQINIEGSPHDDYIVRRVNPYNPFPQEGRRGWNWASYVDVFEPLKAWYDTSGDVILDNSINWVIEKE